MPSITDTGVSRISELQSHQLLQMSPRRRAHPLVCVVTLFTEDLLDGWGRFAGENNANWALAHGYELLVFRRLLVADGVFFGWSHVRALHLALQRAECGWVFLLDGDAVVNRV